MNDNPIPPFLHSHPFPAFSTSKLKIVEKKMVELPAGTRQRGIEGRIHGAQLVDVHLARFSLPPTMVDHGNLRIFGTIEWRWLIMGVPSHLQASLFSLNSLQWKMTHT